MKKNIFKRILSLSLVIVLILGLMTPGATAVVADDADFKLSLVATSDKAGKYPVSAVKAGEIFYLQAMYEGDSATDGAYLVDVFLEYEGNLVTINAISDGILTGSQKNTAYDGDSIVFYGWQTTSGGLGMSAWDPDAEENVFTHYESGKLFRLECVAKTPVDDAVASFNVLCNDKYLTRFLTISEQDIPFAVTNADVNILVPNSISIAGESTIAVAQNLTNVEKDYTATVLDADGKAIESPVVTWALDDDYEGVTLAENGTITVAPSAAAGTIKLTATATKEANSALGNDVSATKEITITKEARRIVKVTPGSVVTLKIPVGSETVTHTWEMEDQYGEPIFINDVTEKCQINDDYRGSAGQPKDDEFAAMGVTFNPKTNTLTVTSAAVAYMDANPQSTPYITYYYDEGWKNLWFELVRAESVPASVEFASDAVASVTIPADGADAVNTEYTGFIVKDQYGEVLTEETVVLTLKEAYDNVSVADNKLIVDPDAAPGTVTLVATVSGTSVTAEKAVALSYADAILQSMEITNETTTFDSAAGQTVTLTASGLDQYNNAMTPADVTWTIAPDNDMVAISGNELTIAKDAYGKFTLTADSGTVTATKEITVNGLYATGSIAEASVTYGDSFETAFAEKIGISVFYGDGVEDTALTGTWTIAPATATAAGEQTVTFVFTSDEHTYTTTKTVNVAKRTLAAADFVVSPASITKEYDCNTNVDPSLGFFWKNDGNVLSADVSFLSAQFSAAYNSSNVSDANKVIITISELTGEKAGNYQLPAEGITIEIPASITPVKVTAPAASRTETYSGSAYTVAAESADYTIAGTNSVTNAGEHSVALSLKNPGNYVWADGTIADKVISLTINKKVVAVPSEKDAVEYTGSAYKIVDAIPEGAMIVSGDRTVTNAGTHTLTLGLESSNYIWSDGSRTCTISLTINPKAVAVPIAKDPVEYNGQPHTIVDEIPEGAVIAAGNNTATNAGTHTLTLGLESTNYVWNDVDRTGERDIVLTIKKMAVSNENVFFDDAEKNQNVVVGVGTFVVPTPRLSDGTPVTVWTATYSIGSTTYTSYDRFVEEILKADTVKAGDTFNVVVTMFAGVNSSDDGNYEGNFEVTINITMVDIAFAGQNAFTANDGTYGDAWTTLFPDASKIDTMIEAKVDTTAVAGDYTLYVDDTAFESLTDIPAVGNHAWSIKFTATNGAYTDVEVASGSVNVAPKSLETATVTGATKTYTGSALTTDVTVVLDGKTLVKDTDYTVEFTNNTDVGSAIITVTGKGNYKDTATGSFTIAQASITGMTATLSPTEYTYDGTPKEPTVAVGILVKDTDFEVSYSNNINAGTATVTITGKGNYSGTLTKTFKINPKALEGEVTLSETEYTFDGTSKKPTATIAGLKEGTDFTVAYSNNTNAGKATVTVTGKGNYSGTLTKQFDIVKADAPSSLKTEYAVAYKYTKTGAKTVEILTIPANAGEVSYGELTVTDAKNIIDTEAAADGKVTFNFTGLSAYEVGVTATITFDLTMANYKTETITVTVKVLDKDVPNVQVADLTIDYTGEEADVKVVSKSSDIPGTWEWVENPTDEDARDEAYDASIKFIPADDYKADYAEKTVSFKVTVKKATASVDSDVDMDENNVVTPDSDDETLNDVLSENDFSVPGTLEWTVTDEDGNVTHPNGDTNLDDIDGEISWTFTPDDTTNYNVIEGSVEDDDYSWLAPVIGGLSGIIASTSKNFKDVPFNAWYAKAVDFVVGRGLFNGVSDKEFNPDGSMTRAMLVTVLWRLEGEPVVGYNNSFRDVESGAWYYDAVTWASSEGIVNGYDAYTFGPNNLITREQMATILYRYAQMRNFNTDFSADLSKYADNGSISGYAREAMSWAVGTGIITGMTETTLNPAGTATRAQVATILMRFIRWYSL